MIVTASVLSKKVNQLKNWKGKKVKKKLSLQDANPKKRKYKKKVDLQQFLRNKFKMSGQFWNPLNLKIVILWLTFEQNMWRLILHPLKSVQLFPTKGSEIRKQGYKLCMESKMTKMMKIYVSPHTPRKINTKTMANWLRSLLWGKVLIRKSYKKK